MRERDHAKALLRDAVERIFEDGVVEPAEREELRTLFSSGGLTVPDVKEVFADFVHATFGDVVADGVVTEAERAKLGAIVRELKLPTSCVPEEVQREIAQ